MPATQELHPHLLDYRRQHAEVRDRYEQLLTGLTLEQFNFCPTPGRWTIAQNIEHLNLEGEEQVEIIERILERGKRKGVSGEGPFHYSAWGTWYLRFLEPPYRTKLPTFKRYTPPPQLTFEEVLPRFRAIKQRVLEQIEEANGLDLARLRAQLPYMPVWNPSLSLGQWFPYIAVHERRHLWQIETFVLSDPKFPRS